MKCGLVFPLVVACSSASPAAKPPLDQVSAPAAVIELKDLTVRFEGHPIARLHPDGRTESVGDGAPGPDAKLLPGPTLHADGTIELTKAGHKGRVESDGDIFVLGPAQEQLFGRIVGDQILFEGARDSGVRLEGANLVLFYQSKPTNVLGQVDPASMGRTALIMAAVFYMEMAVHSPRSNGG